MKVKTGWSAEVANNVWDKCDVELDETDWQQIQFEQGLTDVPVTMEMKFQLIHVETQRLIAAHVAVAHPDLRTAAKQKLAAQTEHRNGLVQKAKDKALQDGS